MPQINNFPVNMIGGRTLNFYGFHLAPYSIPESSAHSYRNFRSMESLAPLSGVRHLELRGITK